MQQWGRWYSQAPVGGRYFRSKKKVHRPQDEKRVPRTERPIHPPRTTQCTLRPPTDQTFPTYSSTAVQQYIQQYTWYAGSSWLIGYWRPCMEQETDGRSFIFWRYLGISGSKRAAVHHPCTFGTLVHNPPSTHGPTQYSSTAMQQYVEQYTWQASSSRFVGYNALGQGGISNCLLFPATPGAKRKALALPILRTASGDGWTLLCLVLLLLCLLLTQARLPSRVHGSVHGSSGQKAIRKFNIVGVRKNIYLAGSDEEKAGGGGSEPSPGGPRSPLAEVGHRRPFSRRHVVVLLCGWDVAAPRGRRRPSGARESPLLGGGVITKIFPKIQKTSRPP